MKVFIQGIHIITLINPQQQEGMLVANYEIVRPNRFQQKIEFLKLGRSVQVLAGGLMGVIDSLPTEEQIVIRLK